MKSAPKLDLPRIRLRRGAGEPLDQQIYTMLQSLIVSGELPGGTRLPSTRAFAKTLGVSRNVVLAAFERLHFEGYVLGKVGRGTHVAPGLPVRRAPTPAGHSPSYPRPHEPRRPSVLEVAMSVPGRELVPFRCDIPALDRFPLERWARLVGSAWRHARPSQLGYGDPQGDFGLRRELSRHLVLSRGVRCSPEDLVITSGSQQTLDILSRILFHSRARLWIEDPCYRGARAAFEAGGASLVPLPVDSQGLSFQHLAPSEAPGAIFVTPAQQYPLGCALSLQRRLELLELAGRQGSWIIEDDYEGELCLEGRALPALQGLDQNQRVIYLGSFSKTMFPGLRLGYAVLPAELLSRFIGLRARMDRHPPAMDQQALAEFFAGGYYARHLGKMRALYAERRDVLKKLLTEHCPGLEVLPSPGGMHLVAVLRGEGNDVRLARAAEGAGLLLVPLSEYYATAPGKRGFVLGFAPFSARRMKEAVLKLKTVLASSPTESATAPAVE